MDYQMHQNSKNANFYHLPVMVKEVVDFLAVKKTGIYVDGTLGGGGHTQALLEKSEIRNPKSETLIIAIDKDIDAIEYAKKRLKRYSQKQNVFFAHANFRNLNQILNKLGIDKVDSILLDLGVSSYQLDTPSRGFSFKAEQSSIPLDMRMDRSQKFSAAEVVNQYDEKQLAKLFFELGEEPFARQIARQIVRRRQEKPILTSNDLLAVVKSATPPKYRYSRRHHYASKIFRAIRMEVNQELEALEEVLPQAISRLKKGGRLVIISFHSLEDRLVKHFFKKIKQEGKVKILTKKPVSPLEGEVKENPRSESAKLRAVQKI